MELTYISWFEKPADKTFEEIVKLVRDHLTPPSSCIVRRFYFNSRFQKETETVEQFVAELRRLSEYCEFGGSLDEMLRDRLVCGLRMFESNAGFSPNRG